MTLVNSNRYQKADNAHIKIGQPVKNSIYSLSGKLLLKKGLSVVSDRQLLTLQKNGYVDAQEPVHNNQKTNLSHKAEAERTIREIEVEIRNSYQNDNIRISGLSSNPKDYNLFEIKKEILDRLCCAFKLLDNNNPIEFKFSIKSLALTIQYQCSAHPDRLLGVLHQDQGPDCNLITPLKRAVICELVGKQAGLGETVRLSMICGAFTCDVGFIDTQNELAMQAEPLTDKQREIIKYLPIKSEKLLLKAGINDPIWLRAVRHHHERFDGSGYPDSLNGDEIPMTTEITAIADAYSAMLKQTLFRNKRTGNKALKLLYAERNKLFNSNTVDLFIKAIGVYPPGTLVKLKNNEIGVVVKRTKNIQTPIVLTLMKPDGSLELTRIERESSHQNYKIIAVLPSNTYNLLQEQLQKVWGGYK